MAYRLPREIALLRRRMLTMSDTVAEQFILAIDALTSGDVEKARRVMERDDAVDALELEIDEHCERIIALHQPVATDLRTILTIVKINGDLERMGDHCKNIAENAKHVAGTPDVLEHAKLRPMADAARTMVLEAKQAFLERDKALARSIPDRDAEVDHLHRENFRALVDFARAHPEQAEVAAHLLTAGKALERISDHAENIAKGVVFLIEGVDIRHRGVKRQEEAM
jgi:phosphate transport system protein